MSVETCTALNSLDHIAVNLNKYNLLLEEANYQDRLEIDDAYQAFASIELFKTGAFETLSQAEGVATQDLLNTPNCYYVLIKQEDKKAGYLIYNLEENGRAFLMAIYLEERYQGKGLGRQSLLELEEILKPMGITSLRLHVFDHNKKAKKVYKQLAYKLIQTNTDSQGNIYGYLMEKDLLPT